MASPELELEDRIKEIGIRLVSPPSGVEELLPLLDQIESLLSRVEQSPSQSMSAALRPAMNALISKEFLEHSDTDVKVAVASCISEITRITAPDAPYDDDLMKVIFRIIVEGFGRLDDIHSRSYSKRISILETVAKVRSCVVMLDLECDELILEMFQHFLKTIRSDHPENVFTSMETIMTLVLEESEDISSELLSSLLDSVKKDKEVLPVARRLGEKVIGNCAVKLKPYLMEVVQSLCAREYSKIVASICQENSDALEHTEINVSGDILADDSKLSERTVSDELPEGSVKQEQEVGSLEKVGTDDKSPRSMMSNGVVQTGDVDSVVEPTSPKQKPERSRRSGQSTNNLASDGPNVDGLEPMSLKSDSIVDVKTKKTRGRKSTSSVLLSNTVDHIQNDSDKEATPLSSRTDRSNEVDNSQIDGPSGKEAESAMPLEPEGKNDTLLAHRSDNGAEAISSPSPSKPVLEADRPKRGRPPGLKVSAKKGVNVMADQPASPSSEKGSQPKDEQLPSADDDSKKDHGDISKLEAKSSRRPGKKVHAENVVDAVASVSVTSDSEGKSSRRLGKKMKAEIVDDTAALVSVMSSSEGKQGSKISKKGRRKKVTGGELSGEQQKSDVKQPKKNASLGKYVAGELISQDVPSTPKSGRSTQSKDQNDLDDSIKTQSRKKRGRGTDKMSKAPSSQNKEAENIVGSGIEIWWPDDQKFYVGKVVSFDAHSGKHKIVYDDGDEEILCLGDERFHLVDETKEGQAADIPSSIGIPEAQVNKKAKTSSDPVVTPASTEVTPMKSSTESGGELVVKRKGRPKGRRSSDGGGIKSNENPTSKAKDETPKSVGRPRGSTNKKSKKKRLSQTGNMSNKKETPSETTANNKKSKIDTSSETSANKKQPKTDNASSSEAAANRKQQPKKDDDDDDTCSPRSKEAAAPQPKSGKRSRVDTSAASKPIKKPKPVVEMESTEEDPATRSGIKSKEDSPPKIARRRRKQQPKGSSSTVVTSEKEKEEKETDVETEMAIDIETTPAAKGQESTGKGKRKGKGKGRGRWARK